MGVPQVRAQSLLQYPRISYVRTSDPTEEWLGPSLVQVRRITHCGRRVSINEQFVLRRYTHLKGYRGIEQRVEGELFPYTTSPLPTPGAAAPVPTIYPMSSQRAPTNLGGQPIGRPLHEDPTSTGGSTHPGAGKHGTERRPGHIYSIA